MPRPAARPSRLVVLSCDRCDLAAEPAPPAAAELAAGEHDDTHHGGRPTAELRTVHTLAQPGTWPGAGGPTFGGAA